MSEYVLPTGDVHVLYKDVKWGLEDYDGSLDEESRTETDSLEEAEVVSSKLRKKILDEEYHYALLDLDVPATLVPSSTPGHSHLYIKKAMTWTQYEDLLLALGDAGILEPGYVRASIARGATMLRTPWTKKPKEDEVAPY